MIYMIRSQKCKKCNDIFDAKTHNALYCKKCRIVVNKNTSIRAWESLNKNGSHGLIGSCSELKVSIDLMIRGFEVYRNVSSHGSIDLIAYGKNGKLIRIEVSTGHQNRETGSRYFPSHPKYKDRMDIYAICYHDCIKYYDKNMTDIEPNGIA